MDDKTKSATSFEDVSLVLRVVGKVLYSEPSNELTEQLRDDTFFDEMPFVSQRAEVQEGIVYMRAWRTSSKNENTEEVTKLLNREWLRLLVGYGEPLAAAWASYYYERSPVLYGRKTLDVRRAYEKYGIMAERKYHEPDDHLGLMCQFLGYLASLQADALSAGDQKKADCLFDEQRSFLASNVLPWIALWCDEVKKNSKSDFYRGLAMLIVGVLYEYAVLLDVPLEGTS